MIQDGRDWQDQQTWLNGSYLGKDHLAARVALPEIMKAGIDKFLKGEQWDEYLMAQPLIAAVPRESRAQFLKRAGEHYDLRRKLLLERGVMMPSKLAIDTHTVYLLRNVVLRETIAAIAEKPDREEGVRKAISRLRRLLDLPGQGTTAAP